MQNEILINRVISECHLKLEQIDNFDMDSGNANSVIKFQELISEHQRLLKKLVKIIKETEDEK